MFGFYFLAIYFTSIYLWIQFDQWVGNVRKWQVNFGGCMCIDKHTPHSVCLYALVFCRMCVCVFSFERKWCKNEEVENEQKKW